MKRMRTLVVVVIWGLVLSGCYTHVPMSLDVAPAGANVRAHLSPEGVVHLEQYTGDYHRILEGRLEGADDEVVSLSVFRSPGNGGMGPAVPLQRISLPRAMVVRWDVRKLDRRRSALFAGGVAAALIGLVVFTLDVDDPGGARLPPIDGEL